MLSMKGSASLSHRQKFIWKNIRFVKLLIYYSYYQSLNSSFVLFLKDLTSKLHQLKMMEQNLVEKMQSIQEQNEVGRAEG